LAQDLSGSQAWSGVAATLTTLGAAIAAIPLARLADRSGRRIALGTGWLLAAVGASIAVVVTPPTALSLDLFVRPSNGR
jgi:MFS family permease